MDRIFASFGLAVLAGVSWIAFLANCSRTEFALGAIVSAIGSVVFLGRCKLPPQRAG